ncbi:hypothetical protein CH370_14565 [Leptospira kmetyi]|nr:hypothetical protein CH370_14565 [Leptospira kmetyi]
MLIHVLIIQDMPDKNKDSDKRPLSIKDKNRIKKIIQKLEKNPELISWVEITINSYYEGLKNI